MTQLAAGVLKELLSTTGVAAEEVNEVILGQVGDKILTIITVLLSLVMIKLYLYGGHPNDCRCLEEGKVKTLLAKQHLLPAFLTPGVFFISIVVTLIFKMI